MRVMYDELYESLFELVSFFIHPKQDRRLLSKTGVSLDTALFPLLMRIAQHASLRIVELAQAVDKDHSTVSRQIDKLIALGLVAPTEHCSDKRVREIRLTLAGRAITKRIAATRRKMMREALRDWDEQQVAELQASLGHLAETVRSYTEH